MAWIQRWIDGGYLAFERLRGLGAVSRHWKPNSLNAQLTGYAVAGYEVQVFCQERVYVRSLFYGRSWRQTHSTYRVFGRVTNDAPASLRRACELDVDLPRLRPGFVSAQLQQQAAVSAYLDLILRKIKEETGTYNPLL